MVRLCPLSNLLRDHFGHEGRSHFKADPLVVSSDPVSSGIFGHAGILCRKAFLFKPFLPHVLTTDTSSYGWGPVCSPLMARGLWSSDQSSLHINSLELGTVFLALKRFQRWLCGAHVLVQTDSTTVMQYLNRAGGTRSRCLDWRVRDIILWCLSMRITLSAVHISGQDNVEVVRLSRFRVENPRRLKRSTEWSLDRRVTYLLPTIFGANLQ